MIGPGVSNPVVKEEVVYTQVDFSVIDRMTGRIICVGVAPELGESTDRTIVVPGRWHPDDYYASFLDGGDVEIVPRTEFPEGFDRTEIKVGESAFIRNVPVGTDFLTDSGTLTVDDGELEVFGSTAGIYEIILLSISHKTKSWTVTVDEV